MTWREKLVAVEDVTTKVVATGMIGVLNNPYWVYERGERRVTLDGKEMTIRALSGERIREPNVSKLDID